MRFDGGPRRLLLIGLGLAVALLVMGLVAGPPGERALLARVFAAVFLAFAAFKGAVGLQARRQLRAAGSDGQRLVEHHGGAAELRRWIAYKMVAMGVALLATLVCLAFGWWPPAPAPG